MPHSKPAMIITSLFFAGLVFDTITQPQIIRELKSIDDNDLVEQMVENHYNAHRNRYLGPTHFKGANLHFRDSATVGSRSDSLLGTHVFSRTYDSRSGVTYRNSVYFIPSVWRVGVALLIGFGLYFGVSRAYPAPKPLD
ncbi:MAG: hypothetical protein AAGA72_08370 [Pseudomonadota bacterium]